MLAPVDCLPVPACGAPQVVDGHKQDGEADKCVGHNDGPQHTALILGDVEDADGSEEVAVMSANDIIALLSLHALD